MWLAFAGGLCNPKVRDGSPQMGMKRECGDGRPEAAAAPATVSGERKARCHWVIPREGGLGASTREPGDLPERQHSNKAAEGAAKEIYAMSSHQNAAAVSGHRAALSQSRAQTVQAALLAAIIGGVLIFVTGFAHPQILHNGAHDTRHGLSFPGH